jgi:hypothetical protein
MWVADDVRGSGFPRKTPIEETVSLQVSAGNELGVGDRILPDPDKMDSDIAGKGFLEVFCNFARLCGY